MRPSNNEALDTHLRPAWCYRLSSAATHYTEAVHCQPIQPPWLQGELVKLTLESLVGQYKHADRSHDCAGDIRLLQEADRGFNAVYEHVIREALDASLCLEASAAVDKDSKEMVVHVRGVSEDTWPLALTNDVDLAFLLTSP